MIDQTPAEPIIEPELPIVDAHHHLWFLAEALLREVEAHDSIYPHVLAPVMRRRAQYLLDEFLAGINTGHKRSRERLLSVTQCIGRMGLRL
jgi:hypothetical protein